MESPPEETPLDADALLALLAWQVELGATEAIGDAPVDRYGLPDKAPRRGSPAPRVAASSAGHAPPSRAPQAATASAGREASAHRPAAPPDATDPIGSARQAAQAARDLTELRAALAAFEHCELRRGARSLVFADGNPAARVMIIGEAPGREEDLQGKPFVGPAGALLDRMLDAIGLSRHAEAPERAVYITNVLPWRPPQNRDPTPEEIAMLRPFLERHVALAAPKIVVLMGNASCQAGLGRQGITRLRGRWCEAFGRPALPMFHPAHLLRRPAAKREAWADLLDLQARLEMTERPEQAP